MLSNALNFLSDKRRRFHRSDTMPAFKIVACSGTGPASTAENIQKETSTEQSNAKQQPTEKSQDHLDDSRQQCNHPQHPQQIDSAQEEISEIYKPSICAYNLNPSSSVAPQRPKFDVAPDFSNFANPTSATQTSTKNTNKTEFINEVSETERLTTENFAHSECDLARPSGGEEHTFGEPFCGSPSKLETLSLPLQGHITSDALSTGFLSGSYSPCPSPLSIGSGSPNLGKADDVQTAHGGCSSTIKSHEKLHQNAQKIHFLCDEKEDLVSGTTIITTNESADIHTRSGGVRNTVTEGRKTNDNKEFTNYVNSARNRVAQIRAKAGGKSKLQRSNSSAQVLRRSRDPVSGTRDRVRATSTQREIIIPGSSVAAETSSHPREQSVDRKRRGRRRGKTWIDKGPRSRSVTSPFHKERSPCEYESGKSKMEMLVELARRATAEQCFKIYVSSSGGIGGVQANLTNVSPPSLGLPNQTNTASALTDPSMGLNSITPNQSRGNRYTVVRRLRRNNSSINCLADRPFSNVENDLTVPTSQTAGDLLLPSKDVLMEKSKRAQEQEAQLILNDLFQWIESRDIEKVVENCQKLIQLNEELSSSSDQNDRHELGLNPLDYAVLVSSPQIITFLIMLGFRPGALLSVTLEHGPSKMRVNDPMKFLLTRRIGDVEATLNTAQVDLDAAIARANSYTIAQRDTGLPDLDQSAMDDALSEVTKCEMELKRATKIRDRLIELRSALDRYPSVPVAPNKVVLMVYNARSLLVRVSPPRSPRLTILNLKNVATSKLTDDSSDTTSCESSSVESTAPTLLEGRRMAGFEPDIYGSLVIRYRIEWSLSADFEKGAGSTTVIPPIRLSSIFPDPKKRDPPERFFIRTGFYELDGLKPGQMIYVRVYAFTVRGWSEPCYSQPRCVAPSSWIDALPKARKNLDKTDNNIPLRYGADLFTEKFHALKKLLDQQLLLWAYRQPSTGNTSEIAGADDTGKRTRSPMIQRKRSFRFPFTTKGMKFVKQTKSGIYLALVCHNSVSRSPSTSDREISGKPHIILVDDFIPMVCVTKEEPTPGLQLSADLNWFARLLAQPKLGTDLQLISDNLLRQTTPANLQFRFLLLAALQRMQMALGSYDVGVLYPDGFMGRVIDPGMGSFANDLSEFVFSSNFSGGTKIVEEVIDNVSSSTASWISTVQPDTTMKVTQNALILVLVKHVQNSNDVACSAGLRWCPLEKFLRQNKMNLADFNLPSQTDSIPSPKISFADSDSGINRSFSTRSDQLYLAPEMHMLSNLDVLLFYSERRQYKLDPGLYVSLIQMHAQFDHQAKILVTKTAEMIHMLPVERVRRRTHVCRLEWNTLYNLLVVTDPDSTASCPRAQTVENEPYALRFCQKLHKAWLRLAKRLNYTEDELTEFRFYLPEVIQISPEHTLILIFPKTDQVCLPPGQSSSPPPCNCSWIFMTYFERNLGSVYDPEFYNTAASLMSILEVLIPMSTLMQRQCITDSELSHCTERTNTLQSIYHQVESAYQEKRWLSEAISAARDRKRPYAFTLLSRTLKLFVDSVIRHADSGKYGLRVVGDLGEIRLGRSEWKDVLYIGSANTLKETIQLVERKANTYEIQNLLSVCHVSEDTDLLTGPATGLYPAANHDRQVSVIRVYAGYATGLGSGTSVKILTSIRTTARDIVDAVIIKLNRTLETKRQNSKSGKHASNLNYGSILETADSNRFCLTVSLGAIERVIPDDFRLLLLQEPWRSGKLYVRLIHEVQQFISSNSPPRLYFATEVHSNFELGENTEMVKFLLTPVRSDRAQFSVIQSVVQWVRKTNPPTVYVDGKPVINV